jgi:hypothetical protein
LTPLESAITLAAASALRRRAALMRSRAAAGSATVKDHPGVVIRSPEAALAERMAAEYEAIAGEIVG